jgi:hypothetical protein
MDFDSATRYRHRALVLMRGDEKGPLPPEMHDLALDLYDSGIAYTDAAVGRLLSRLEELGIDDRTVVVITSDHGEMFGEHGLYNHTSLYDENLLVPLVFGLPAGEAAGTRIADQVRLVDIMPTLLDLVGLEKPAGMNGVSLLPLIRGGTLPDSAEWAWSYAAASNFGISVRDANRTKYIYNNNAWQSSLPTEVLFDLGLDPSESDPHFDPDSEGVVRWRESTDRELREGVSGVRVVCDNRSGRTNLRCVLKGEGIRRDTLKITGFGEPAFKRLSQRRARAMVPPGEILEASVEVSDPGSLRVRVSEAEDHTVGGQLDFDYLHHQGTQAVVERDGRWSVEENSSGPVPGTRGVYVSWFGRPVDEVGVFRDEEVSEQLRALGYVQ